jgi:hypothetical protein
LVERNRAAKHDIAAKKIFRPPFATSGQTRIAAADAAR